MSASDLQAYAAGKRFRAVTTARWLACSELDQRATYRVIDALRLGENQVRDLLDTLDAIIARRGGTMADVLSSAPVRAVLDAQRARNETLHGLKCALRRLRFPQLTHAEARLQALAKELYLPTGVTLRFPENLEGDAITLTVCAASASDLRRRLAATSAALASEGVDEMFRVLGGDW